MLAIDFVYDDKCFYCGDGDSSLLIAPKALDNGERFFFLSNEDPISSTETVNWAAV